MRQVVHVGLDITSPKSVCSQEVAPLGISFWKRDVIYAWIEYFGTTNSLQVRVANTSLRPVCPGTTHSMMLLMRCGLDSQVVMGKPGLCTISTTGPSRVLESPLTSHLPHTPRTWGLLRDQALGAWWQSFFSWQSVSVCFWRSKRAQEEFRMNKRWWEWPVCRSS